MKFIAVPSCDFENSFVHAPRDFFDSSPCCMPVLDWVKKELPCHSDEYFPHDMKRMEIVLEAYAVFNEARKEEKDDLRHTPWICLDYRWDRDATFIKCFIFKCENNGNTYIVRPDGDIPLHYVGY